MFGVPSWLLTKDTPHSLNIKHILPIIFIIKTPYCLHMKIKHKRIPKYILFYPVRTVVSKLTHSHLLFKWTFILNKDTGVKETDFPTTFFPFRMVCVICNNLFKFKNFYCIWISNKIFRKKYVSLSLWKDII